ncbi:hypothetical protein EV664_107158 [Stakelama pacifica]|uniref:Uncharacterized protein n=1 Tax=Stakelama pacifica TaxID=517720 RepID=A0A4R6FJV4_9SPHN|nr:hypothetical protein EV664_107158 [Stakelama pacifica]
MMFPARVLLPCAIIDTRTGVYSFHRVSDPVRRSLPHFSVDRPAIIKQSEKPA